MAKRRKRNLSGMDFESLVKLRQQVEDRLHDHRATLKSSWKHWELRSCRLVVEGFRVVGEGAQ